MTVFNYTVNYIDVAIVGIFLLFAVIGYNRGLLINVVNFIRYAVGLFLCFFLSEKLYQTAYNSFVRAKALEYINQKIVRSNLDETLKNLQGLGKSLPDFISKAVDFKSISISSDNVAESILNNLFEPVLLFLTKAAIFLAVFLIFFLVTGIIILLVRRASRKREEKRGRKSAVKITDKILGAVIGLLKASVIILAIVSVLMYILNLNDDAEQLSSFMREVQNSALFNLISEYNPFNAVTEGLI